VPEPANSADVLKSLCAALHSVQGNATVCRDLWRLDLKTWEWEELKMRGGPSARSGHRMLCHQGTIWMFGGYYDAGDTMPKYYCDLWAFNPAELTWSPVGDMRAKWPKPRSGFQWVAFEGYLVLHGGYSKSVDDNDKELEHGVAMEDTWCWHLTEQKWERKNKAGMAPSKRASFAMALHKNRAILFGGTADEEAKGGEVLVSSFFNDLYQLNLSQWRWYPVAMRPQKGGAGALLEGSMSTFVIPRSQHSCAPAAVADAEKLQARLGRVVTDEEAAKIAAATRIQAHYRGHVVRKAMKLYRIGGMISEVLYSPAAYGVDLSSQNSPKPRARINANMCVVKNTLWLFGGIVEIGDQEVRGCQLCVSYDCEWSHT
jgi:hypothetical protein